jgi:cytidine deaminase
VPGLSDEEAEALLAAAEAASSRAYAPYSHIRVGAAVLTGAGTLYAGCNVENASSGLGVCAERNALAAAVVAEGGDGLAVRAVAVRTHDLAACPPCGTCRQVLAELAPDAVVLFQTAEGLAARTVTELLPDAFGGEEPNAR